MNKFILAISLALAIPAFAAEPAKEPAKKAAPAKKAETLAVHCDLKKDPKCKDVTKKPMTKEEREAKKKAKEAEAK